MGYYNQCYTGGHPIGPHYHDDDGRIYNFEQFSCERSYEYRGFLSKRIVAHSIIKVYTRNWRDLFRKRVWIRCWYCDGRWPLQDV